MTPPRSNQGFIRMPDAEFEVMLARAAEEGAKRALADVGLDGDEAALDIRDHVVEQHGIGLTGFPEIQFADRHVCLRVPQDSDLSRFQFHELN